MASLDTLTYITCKSCEKSLLGIDELVVLFDHIRVHDSNHFNIPTISNLVDHFEKVCDKFKDNTSHDEAERYVRYSITNMLDFESKKFSVFKMNKEMLDYIHYKTIVT